MMTKPTVIEDDDVYQLSLWLAENLGGCEQPGDVQVAALLHVVAFLITQADDPTKAAAIAKIGLEQEIAAALDV